MFIIKKKPRRVNVLDAIGVSKRKQTQIENESFDPYDDPADRIKIGAIKAVRLA